MSWGFRVAPNAEFSVLDPMANSSRLVLPTTIAPASRSLVTTVASYGGRQPSRIFDEQVVGMPCVHKLSLRAIGTPASGPGSRPTVTASSISAARARASSASTRLKAWMSPSRSSIVARCRSSTSSALGRRSRSEHLVAVEAVHLDVLAHHVGDGRGMGHRLDIVEIERIDVGEVVEHGAQLVGRLVELVVAQRQPRELGHLGDSLWGDAVGHEEPRYRPHETPSPSDSHPEPSRELASALR